MWSIELARSRRRAREGQRETDQLTLLGVPQRNPPGPGETPAGKKEKAEPEDEAALQVEEERVHAKGQGSTLEVP